MVGEATVQFERWGFDQMRQLLRRRQHGDPTTISKYLEDEKIIDNKGNFSLVQMGLMNDG